MNYELTVTEDQARVLRDACELYARIGMGQISFISEHPALHQLQALVRDGVVVADRIAQHYRDKIEHPHPGTQRSWDLYQVIRGRLAWDAAGNPPVRPTIQVMYDEPLNTAGEPLAVIQAADSASELEELKALLKFYFSQDDWQPSNGHVPHGFVKFIGCVACDTEGKPHA